MDNDEEGGYFRGAFRSFVCVTLSIILGLQAFTYMWGQQHDSLDNDFSSIKYIVMQLTNGLTEVNRKHEHLQNELERLSGAVPAAVASAARARAALEPKAARTQLDQFDYDRQIVDYALETAGARVVDTGETVGHVVYESPVSWALHLLTSMMCKECISARSMIRPGSLPGECWAFKGSKGEAVIRLLGAVHVTGISIEHIPPHISPTKEISSAPRIIHLEGLESRSDPFPHDYGSFEYDREGRPIQYFEVLHASSKSYHLVRVSILANWGHPIHTCVYRIRIHGDLAPGQVPKQTIIDDNEPVDIE